MFCDYKLRLRALLSNSSLVNGSHKEYDTTTSNTGAKLLHITVIPLTGGHPSLSNLRRLTQCQQNNALTSEGPASLALATDTLHAQGPTVAASSTEDKQTLAVAAPVEIN